MRILVDASAARSQGIRRYFAEIVREWPSDPGDEWSFVNESFRVGPLSTADFQAWVAEFFSPSSAGARSRGADRVLGMLKATRVLRRSSKSADVVWSLAPSIVPLSGRRVVTTIHDLQWLWAPDSTGPLSRRYRSRNFRRAVRESTELLAVSATTASDLRRFAPSTTPINTIALTGAHAIRYASTRTPTRSGVAVVAHSEHKRAEEVLRLLDPDTASAVTLLCGSHSRKVAIEFASGTALENLRRSGVQVIFLCEASDPEYFAVVEQAEALILNSEYEGFGLPVAEAIAMGTPVITSSHSALLELNPIAAQVLPPHPTRSDLQSALDSASTVQGSREVANWFSIAHKTRSVLAAD